MAARCSCGATVFHESRSVVDGFVRDHAPGRRDRCTSMSFGDDLDALNRPAAVDLVVQGVLFELVAS
jgi:hypothetical protein